MSEFTMTIDGKAVAAENSFSDTAVFISPEKRTT